MKNIEFKAYGAFGLIKLMRPKALNALTHKMILEMEKNLIRWKKDPEIFGIIVEAEGNRAFCAGGDITDLYARGIKGDFQFGQNFWADEYRLNSLIATYQKPFVVFMQGYTMGGGVGIACHGTHRIVGESSKIAMPEVGIGLVPDVGGSFLLANAPKTIGPFLGVTSYQMNAADAIFSNFADYFVPETNWGKLKADLIKSQNLDIIESYAVYNHHSKLKELLCMVEDLFHDTTDTENLIKRFKLNKNLETDFRRMEKASPISIASTLKILQDPNVAHSVNAALEIEFRFTSRAQEFGDFQEGVRAMVIDKDHKPLWKHRDLTSISQISIDQLLAPLNGKMKALLKLGD